MDEMENRISRLEWETERLRESQERQDARLVALGERMSNNHQEVMGAISSLRDDRARQEGAEVARQQDAQRYRDRLKTAAVIVSIIGLLATLGWIGNNQGIAAQKPPTPPDPPIPIQPTEDARP